MRNVFQEVNPDRQDTASSGGGLMDAARNNPVLTGALALGLGAVSGPQMLNVLRRTMSNPKASVGQIKRFYELLEPHVDAATDAWKMVGGSGPTKLNYLGGGVDAATFGVRPGNVVLKLARPGGTHMGWDPHKIADTAPRNVLLPVLEHGQFRDPMGKGLSWFVQPRAKTPDKVKLRTLERMGEKPLHAHEVYDQLLKELQTGGHPWTIIDTHPGNTGRWAGRNWIIDIGSMQRLPAGQAAKRTPTPPSGPQGITPASPPPGWATPVTSLPTPSTINPQHGKATVDWAKRVAQKKKGEKFTSWPRWFAPIGTRDKDWAEQVLNNFNQWGLK